MSACERVNGFCQRCGYRACMAKEDFRPSRMAASSEAESPPVTENEGGNTYISSSDPDENHSTPKPYPDHALVLRDFIIRMSDERGWLRLAGAVAPMLDEKLSVSVEDLIKVIEAGLNALSPEPLATPRGPRPGTTYFSNVTKPSPIAVQIGHFLHGLDVNQPLAWHMARGLAEKIASLIESPAES